MTNDNEQETAWTPKATIVKPAPPIKPLTRKQKAFVQHLIENPKASATAAAKAAYNVTTDGSAQQVAHDNLSKPNILLELSKHSQTAEYTLLEVMGTSKEFSKIGNTAGASYATTAVAAANSILDRLHGKATQRTEVRTEAVTLNIDLTGTLEQGQLPDNSTS